MKKSENLIKYGPFFIIFPLPVMLKFTVHTTAVHLFTCVAKAVTSRRSRDLDSDVHRDIDIDIEDLFYVEYTYNK